MSKEASKDPISGTSGLSTPNKKGFNASITLADAKRISLTLSARDVDTDSGARHASYSERRGSSSSKRASTKSAADDQNRASVSFPTLQKVVTKIEKARVSNAGSSNGGNSTAGSSNVKSSNENGSNGTNQAASLSSPGSEKACPGGDSNSGSDSNRGSFTSKPAPQPDVSAEAQERQSSVIGRLSSVVAAKKTAMRWKLGTSSFLKTKPKYDDDFCFNFFDSDSYRQSAHR